KLGIVQGTTLQVYPLHVVACPLQAVDELLGEYSLVSGVRVLTDQNSHAIRASRRVPGPRLSARGPLSPPRSLRYCDERIEVVTMAPPQPTNATNARTGPDV